ncbi:MAG: tetraacyldisaccharide 4'-kinase [Campylobacterales bacterium]|nr:tetraacyldisaccharide 4'-kinase [Campylobacterales bacterium]
MKNSFVFWVEEYFYNPTPFQKIFSYIFLPLSWLYCLVMYTRFLVQQPHYFGIPVVSVGNLTVGGSGKTPLVSSLAASYKNAAIVLRGYGRETKGLYIVKDREEILCDVTQSGDEAMIYAQKLPNAIVIVSEDRKSAILKAKELGADVVFLDDAYSKHSIEKLDLLIEVQSQNNFCLPSGPFRERLYVQKNAIVLEEEKDFKRVVTLKDRCDKMSLITAIARPQRLDAYLPEVVSKNYFADHHSFTKDECIEVLRRDGSDSLLVTYKDFVKVQSFGLPLSLLDLDVEVSKEVIDIVGKYIENKN